MGTVRVRKSTKKLILQVRSKMELETGIKTTFEDAIIKALEFYLKEGGLKNDFSM